MMYHTLRWFNYEFLLRLLGDYHSFKEQNLAQRLKMTCNSDLQIQKGELVRSRNQEIKLCSSFFLVPLTLPALSSRPVHYIYPGTGAETQLNFAPDPFTPTQPLSSLSPFYAGYRLCPIFLHLSPSPKLYHFQPRTCSLLVDIV